MINIIYLGGSKNGESGKFAPELQWERLVLIKKTTQQQHGLSMSLTMEEFHEEYVLKIIKRNSELKIFYIFKDLKVDEIKVLSEQNWEGTYTIGYDFS